MTNTRLTPLHYFIILRIKLYENLRHFGCQEITFTRVPTHSVRILEWRAALFVFGWFFFRFFRVCPFFLSNIFRRLMIIKPWSDTGFPLADTLNITIIVIVFRCTIIITTAVLRQRRQPTPVYKEYYGYPHLCPAGQLYLRPTP